MDAVQVLQKKIWNINIKPVFLSGDELDKEIQRSEAMTKIADQIIKNGDLQFKAMKHMDEYGYERTKAVPEMLEVRETK